MLKQQIFVKDKAIFACILMAFSSSLLMASYELIRNPITVLFKQSYGMDYFPIALALVPLLLVLCLSGYNLLLTHKGPRKTYHLTFLFSFMVLFIGSLFIRTGFKKAVFFIFLFRECYVVLLIEQSWSFVSSLVSEKRAKKLYSFILAISTVGASLGGLFVYKFAKTFGSINILGLGTILMVPSQVIAYFAYKKAPKSLLQTKPSRGQDKKSFLLGMSFFKTYPVLTGILFLILTSQIYSTACEIIFQSMLHEYIPETDKQVSFSGLIFSFLGAFALFNQLILSPILFSRLSLFFIHAMIPALHLLALFFLLWERTIFSAAVAFIIFKSFDYSVFRVAKELLYLPLPFDARFRTKEFIDVFAYRIGKGGTSVAITMMQKTAGSSLLGLSSLAFLAIIAWLTSVVFTFKHDVRQSV